MNIIYETKRIVCSKTGITINELEGRSRLRHIVESRNICYAILREKTGMTLKKIGEVFNNRDHTTIMYGLKIHDDMMTSYGNQDYKYNYRTALRDLEYQIIQYEYEPIINAS